jgi:hypothetical protein
MTKEGEPSQRALLSVALVDPSLLAVVIEPEGGERLDATEDLHDGNVPTGVRPAEVERPRPTIREVRAIRSLLYNRLLLEVVQRRIEKAEVIILSYLLIQGETGAQIGPYLVEVDADHGIGVTRIADDDGWHQPYFPEMETISTT